MSEILALLDPAQPRLNAELLSAARRLADNRRLVAIFSGPGTPENAPGGPDVVYAISAEWAETHPARRLAMGEFLERREPPELVMAGASPACAALAATLAAQLDADLLQECQEVESVPGGLRLVTGAFDERCEVTWFVPAPARLVAVVSADFLAPRLLPSRPLGVVLPLRSSYPAPGLRVQLKRRIAARPETSELEHASRVVAAGLGIGGPDLLPDIERLAHSLGAATGASRPLADRGWVPVEKQIGTTGRRVRPELYIALGISGASQHAAAIEGDPFIIAINSDPAAPVMRTANLAAVGEVRPVLRHLLALIDGLAEP